MRASAGAATVLFAGGDGGRARRTPTTRSSCRRLDAARIQELHVLLMHLLLDQRRRVGGG